MDLSKGVERPLVGAVLFKLYAVRSRRVRAWIYKRLVKWERGSMWSVTLRRIFQHYHQIEVDLFSGGACFSTTCFREGPPGTKIGSYCSITDTVRRFNANHPMNVRSSHAVFYNPALKMVKEDKLPRSFIEIGHDVWIGHNAVILSSVRKIGNGAVIGAGAVVHQDVPAYAILVGNPARVVRYRFSKEKIAEVEASRWWEKSPDELLPEFDEFVKPLEGSEIR